MSQKQATPSKNYKVAKEQVYDDTPKAIVAAIATQLDRAEEAAERIVREGSVVRDMKGSVIPHPAIQVEINAIKLYTDLIKKWSDE